MNDPNWASPPYAVALRTSLSDGRCCKNGQPFRAYARAAGKAPLSGKATVPMGSYHFVVICQNAIQRCQVSYTVDSLY